MPNVDLKASSVSLTTPCWHEAHSTAAVVPECGNAPMYRAGAAQLLHAGGRMPHVYPVHDAASMYHTEVLLDHSAIGWL
jgi:hypothetical protein